MQHKNSIIKPKSTTFLKSQTCEMRVPCARPHTHTQCGGMHAWTIGWKRPQLNCLIQLYVCSCLLHTTHINYLKFGYYYKTLTAHSTLYYSLYVHTRTHARIHSHARQLRRSQIRCIIRTVCVFRFEAKRQSQPMATKLTTATTERQPPASVVHQNTPSIIHNLNAGAVGASAFSFPLFFRCSGQNSSLTVVKCLMHCIHSYYNCHCLCLALVQQYTYRTHPNRCHTVNSTAFG